MTFTQIPTPESGIHVSDVHGKGLNLNPYPLGSLAIDISLFLVKFEYEFERQVPELELL